MKVQAANNSLNCRSLRSLDVQKLRFCPPVSLIVRCFVSNTNIASRILEIVSKFEQGLVPNTAIAECIELHEPALEGTERKIRDQLHKFSVQIITEDLSPHEEEMLGISASRNAVEQLKSLLKSIK